MQNGKKVATVNDKNNKDWETKGENISLGIKIPINKLCNMIIENIENEAILNNIPTKDKYLIGRFE